MRRPTRKLKGGYLRARKSLKRDSPKAEGDAEKAAPLILLA